MLAFNEMGFQYFGNCVRNQKVSGGVVLKTHAHVVTRWYDASQDFEEAFDQIVGTPCLDAVYRRVEEQVNADILTSLLSNHAVTLMRAIKDARGGGTVRESKCGTFYCKNYCEAIDVEGAFHRNDVVVIRGQPYVVMSGTGPGQIWLNQPLHVQVQAGDNIIRLQPGFDYRIKARPSQYFACGTPRLPDYPHVRGQHIKATNGLTCRLLRGYDITKQEHVAIVDTLVGSKIDLANFELTNA